MPKGIKLRIRQTDRASLPVVDFAKLDFRAHCTISIPCLPKSLNHQYRRGENHKQVYLRDEVKQWREMVNYCCLGKRFEAQGVLCAIVEFCSPKWVSKEHRVRQMDADNKVKALFDALGRSLGFDDQRIWQFHVFKIFSQKEITRVTLLDLGDIVDCVK